MTLYTLKTFDGRFLIVKMDSLGYTVDGVTEDENQATRFDLRKEARDVKDCLDSYWAEQVTITITPDCPF